jgi:hypothetical protein
VSNPGDRRGFEPSGGVSVSFTYGELIATGLAGSLLAFLAAQWALPGVLLGALSPMASVVIMAIVKAYLSGAAVGGPRLPGLLYVLTAFWWFASRSGEVQKSILLAGLQAGAVASVISASTVVVTQAAAGEDLPCLVWEECGPVDPGSDAPGPSSKSPLEE